MFKRLVSKSAIPIAKKFARGDRVYVGALQAWQILTAFVMFGRQGSSLGAKTMSYGDLARAMGYEDARAGHTLSRQLGIVARFCIANDLPPLNAIVVVEATGAPGEEVLLREGQTSWRKEQKAVAAHDWFAIRPPTTGTLRKIWEAQQQT